MAHYACQVSFSICSLFLNLIIITVTVLATKCPDLYDGSPGSLHNNYCHYFNLQSGYSFEQCLNLCQSRGATLLCTTDATSNTFFSSEINGLTWVGYNAMQKSYLNDCLSDYDPSSIFVNTPATYKTASVLVPNTGNWQYACPTPCDGSPELYNCACSSVEPLNHVMRVADHPINQHVICEGGGCSSPVNSTAADMQGVDSAFESSAINQQIQETLRRTQDFIRRYLDAGKQRIDSMKNKLNATLAEQRDTKQFLTKFMMDRQTDYVSAKEALQSKLQDVNVKSTTEL